MALVSSVREIPQPLDRIRYPELDLSGLSEIMEEPPPLRTSPTLAPSTPPYAAATVAEEAIYVAVGKEVKEAELTLTWALHNPGGRKIIILHVHQPSQKISMMGANVPINRLEESFVRVHHAAERQEMHKTLDKYISTCKRAGVRAEKLYIEMDSIEKGIVELISLHGIKKLVIGAAAKNQYSKHAESTLNLKKVGEKIEQKKMMEPKSKKAIYVRLQAPNFCHIWFICKGHLIYTREGTPSGISMNVSSPVLPEHSSPETGQSYPLMNRSATQVKNDVTQSARSVPDYRRIHSENSGVKFTALSPSNSTGGATIRSRLSVEGSNNEWDWMSRGSPSAGSHFSSCSSCEIADDLALLSITQTERSENELETLAPQQTEGEYLNTSPSSRVLDGTMYDELYDRLQQYVEEAENSRREAYKESIRRGKAEKNSIEARRRAKASETMYSEELGRRKEIEESLARAKEESEKMKLQLDDVKENLQAACLQRSSLESQVEASDKMIEELEQKMFSAVELLQKYKKERDELQMERDNVLSEAEELRNFQAEGTSSASISCFFSEYSFSEIEEATHNFDPALKIGVGGYGSIYRGVLRHTQVAIKMLHPHSSQGPLEFQQEVNILSKLRHPNIVTLIGACPEAWALVYEYLPNGSLEDRLSCKENSSPLSWQTRIRIAAELCSVLIFLHSCSPQGIVHGDLKPANILLDANYMSKLSDFGICRVLFEDEFSENNTSLCCRTDPKGTFAYMDPEFIARRELTSKSDVYSFGIILMRLLTGKSALGITKEVQYALSKGNLKNVLDPTAGDWPFVQAKQLAHLAISCCEMNRKNRPELASEVWRVLEPMRVFCGASSSRLNTKEQSYIPSYFICPIFQEIMQDPVVAADGFTYEAEAAKGWLDSGHDTSPMTNLKLAHTNLVPNHALRSAIQEWLQQS